MLGSSLTNQTGNLYGASSSWIASIEPPAPLVALETYRRGTALPSPSCDNAQTWLDWASIRA